MNKIVFDNDGMADFLKEAVYGVLLEISNSLANRYIYHFTDFKSALKIMKSDEIYLSRTMPSSVDLLLSDNSFTYLSFTRNGNIQTSQYPLQINQTETPKKINVRFTVEKEALKQIGSLKKVDFHLQKAADILDLKAMGMENSTAYKKKIEFFKKYGLRDDFTREELIDLAKKMGTEESRFTNDKSSIKDFSNYVTYVDFLINPFFYQKFDIFGVSRMLSTMPKWKSKIRIFTEADDFDNRENFQTVEDVLSGKEETLTKEEERELLKISDNYINEKTLIAISKLFYLICYSSKGFDTTVGNAERLLSRLFGNTEIRITSAKEKEYGEHSPIKDAILEWFGEIGGNLGFGEINNLFTETKNIFSQLSQNLATCRFVLAKIIDAYSDWLRRYKKSVDRKLFELQNEMNALMPNNIAQIIDFARRNVYVFEIICKKYLPKEKELITQYLNALLEYRKPKQRMSLAQILSELLGLLGFDRLKREIKTTYEKDVYHYFELLFFKRSVMLYKNNFITKVRKTIGDSTFSKVGDLAVLYNNAEKANQENDL